MSCYEVNEWDVMEVVFFAGRFREVSIEETTELKPLYGKSTTSFRLGLSDTNT